MSPWAYKLERRHLEQSRSKLCKMHLYIHAYTHGYMCIYMCLHPQGMERDTWEKMLELLVLLQV